MLIKNQSAALVENIEQLSEISKGSLSYSDQSLGLQSVKAMNRILIYYLALKEKDALQINWYGDIDDFFLGLNKPIVQDLKIRRYWFEYKVFQEYESILVHFLGKDSKIAYQVAINATEIGEIAIQNMDIVVVDLITKYFNTFLRRCIDKHQVQTSVDFLYQYYNFLESLMRSGIDDSQCLRIANYFKYYGQQAARLNMEAVLEFSSYFLRLINEFAYEFYGESNILMVNQLLDLFLTVDDFPDETFSERALIGVRQNQAILASFYLLHNEESLVRKIYLDMKEESPERLQTIKDSILQTNEESFFEIDNIGINPLFITQSRREVKVIEFFNYLATNQCTKESRHE